MVRSWPLVSTRASRLPCASKWSRASVSGSPVSSARTSITRAANPAGVLMPVPTAVPPSGSSATPRQATTRAARCRAAAARRTRRTPGRASPGWRPSGGCGRTSRRWRTPPPWPRTPSARWSSAGMRSRLTAVGRRDVDRGRERVVARLAGVDVVVRVDRRGRALRVARVAMTSLAFMLLDVPEPVWKTSIGNSPSCCPSATSSAACSMACADVGVEDAELGVDPGRRRLDQREGVDVRRLERACPRSGSSRPRAGSAPATARRAGRGPRPSCRARSGIASSLMAPPYDRPTTPSRRAAGCGPLSRRCGAVRAAVAVSRRATDVAA